MSRLTEDMVALAVLLRNRADGYRITGAREPYRAAMNAYHALDLAVHALDVLDVVEARERNSDL